MDSFFPTVIRLQQISCMLRMYLDLPISLVSDLALFKNLHCKKHYFLSLYSVLPFCSTHVWHDMPE